ncbi:MAG: formate--tetrahydrofolate ligase [Deltaproteobacteria bacterium]|nr:formate--tetrahydrofolate ligase [Deltaproteobacteria bacterium]
MAIKTPQLRPVEELASETGIPARFVSPYGRHIAKVDHRLIAGLEKKRRGRLIVVTSMSPAPAGTGKTTLTIGLTDALRLIGKKAIGCVRQPSLGPFFGAKGGATGSGLAQIHPTGDIALHFTGDDHAATTAHNLIASLVDNHIYHGNRLGIDARRILWRRVSVLNDRALRRVRINSGDVVTERPDEFRISASSEVMASLCMSLTLPELKARLGRMLLAFDEAGGPITADSLKSGGAATALLRNALDPNLVQSTQGSPVFVHGTPFGNLSIGCSSLAATTMALGLADYCVIETGFSTELGAEKFFNIICRASGLRPAAVVITANLRALRLHGGAKDPETPDNVAAIKGIANLRKHCENIETFGLPHIVAINRFADDPAAELTAVMDALEKDAIRAVITDVHEQGGKGGLEAAAAIQEVCDRQADGFRLLYPDDAPTIDKINTIATQMYGAIGVTFTGASLKDLADIERLGLGRAPVCMAKTPASLSDNAALPGRPAGFKVEIRQIYPATGAGFIVALAGPVLLMPGLPLRPRSELMDVDRDGNLTVL